MYNAEQKLRFISEEIDRPKQKVAYEERFNRIEPFETQLGKDICECNAEELQSVVDKIAEENAFGVKLTATYLKKYIRWCMDVGLSAIKEKEIASVMNTSLDSVRRSTVFSPASLQDFLDAVYEPEKDHTFANVMRAYCWLAYMGIESDDALQMDTSCVNFYDMVIDMNGKQYTIYREALQSFRNCAELTGFVYKHPNYTENIIRPRVAGTGFLRGLKSSGEEVSMRTGMSRANVRAIKQRKTDKRLTYVKLMTSGLFYRVYTVETSVHPSQRSTAVRAALRAAFADENISQGSIVMKAFKYKKKYDEWKEAYTL